MHSVVILDSELTASAEVEAFENLCAQQKNTGAIVFFTGYVRVDQDVEKLYLEHYPGLTESQVDVLCDEARQRFDLQATFVVHRIGWMKPGETIVFVACASEHRQQAFQACSYIMDQLKTRVPFWKKELRGGVEQWVEQKESDILAQQHW